MGPEYVTNTDFSVKDKAITWVFNQGVSTVLLIAMCTGIWFKVPYVMDKIESGYVKNADAHQKIADKNLEAMQLSRESVISMVDSYRTDAREHRRLVIELLKRAPVTAEDFSAAVEAASKKD